MSMIKSLFQSTASLTPSWLPPRNANADAAPLDDAEGRSRHSSPSPLASASTSLSSHRFSGLPAPNRNAGSAAYELARTEAGVRRRLQSLLDAQAEGLIANVGGAGAGGGDADADTHSSAGGGSSLAGSASQYGERVVPVRQPAGRPVSLREARRGIHAAMLDLAAIKDGEVEASDAALQQLNDDLEQMASWEERRRGLEEGVAEIRRGGATARVAELEEQDRALQEQIQLIEEQLARSRNEQGAVRAELTRVGNSVDSQLSSYRQSLQLVDKQIQASLRQPRQPSQTQLQESTYLSLPAERRTLEMAAEHTREERRAVEERRSSLREERDAVEAGITIWGDAVEAVTTFEKGLRASMTSAGRLRGGSEDATVAESSSPAPPSGDGSPDIETLLERMDEVIVDLDSKVKLADARGWRLLVCCIGAELEAFRQGRQMLRDALFAASDEPESDDRGSSAGGGAYSESSEVSSAEERYTDTTDGPYRDTRDAMRNSSSTIVASGGRGQRLARPARLYDDDEPDVGLLISGGDPSA